MSKIINILLPSGPNSSHLATHRSHPDAHGSSKTPISSGQTFRGAPDDFHRIAESYEIRVEIVNILSPSGPIKPSGHPQVQPAAHGSSKQSISSANVPKSSAILKMSANFTRKIFQRKIKQNVYIGKLSEIANLATHRFQPGRPRV